MRYLFFFWPAGYYAFEEWAPLPDTIKWYRRPVFCNCAWKKEERSLGISPMKQFTRGGSVFTPRSTVGEWMTGRFNSRTEASARRSARREKEMARTKNERAHIRLRSSRSVMRSLNLGPPTLKPQPRSQIVSETARPDTRPSFDRFWRFIGPIARYIFHAARFRELNRE